MEALRLRKKDIDFDYRAIIVRNGESGADIRTVQEQLGHSDVRTTQINTHVLKNGGYKVVSPLSSVINLDD